MFLRETYWHELFETGLLLKAFNSAWEITGGFLLLANVRGWFPHLFVLLTRAVFLGYSNNRVLHLVVAHVHTIAPGTQLFVAIYLLFHGVVNLFLSYNLYKSHLWAYPFTVVFTSTFLIYQVYRLAHTHSLVLLMVSVLDFIFIILTWHEYKHQLAKTTRHASHA